MVGRNYTDVITIKLTGEKYVTDAGMRALEASAFEEWIRFSRKLERDFSGFLRQSRFSRCQPQRLSYNSVSVRGYVLIIKM
jgi:hypothetical protein